MTAVMMEPNAIQIVVRVRPWHPEKEAPFVAQHVNQPFFHGAGAFAESPRKVGGGTLKEVVEVMDHRQIDFDRPEAGAETRRGMPGARKFKDKRYIFDRVFGMPASQEEVFEHTAKPLLAGVLDGLNATVFAYGATGCGKTHTITGTQEDPGVTKRIVRELFDMAGQLDDNITITLSMVEIYNEVIRDLLNDNYPGPSKGLLLLEDQNSIKIAGVRTLEPQSADEVMDLIILGNSRRSTSYTASNSQSSRSHAVLQINVTRQGSSHEVDEASENVKRMATYATLSIIDLAGSEKAAATTNMGMRMKEGANINRSLLELSNCIEALCQSAKQRKKLFIPFRNSKLTRMLKFSLGGNCRTVMIVCVSPSSTHIEDTSNTLVWANKAKDVKTSVSRNTAGQHVTARQYLSTINEQSQRIKLLEGEIEKLQKQGFSAYKASSDSARLEANRWLNALKSEMEGGLPMIKAGAMQRALWDTNDIRLAALRAELAKVEKNVAGRPADEISRQKSTLSLLICQLESAFSQNRQVSNLLSQEASATTSIIRTIKTNEDRPLESMDKTEYVNFKLGVAAQRTELEKQVSLARERGYREAAQSVAEALVQVIGAAHGWTSTLQEESDLVAGMAQSIPGAGDLAPTADRLAILQSSMVSELAKIFGNSKITAPPPVPVVPSSSGAFASIGQIPLMSPAKRLPPPPPRALGPPSRGTPSKASNPFRANPSAQRVLASSSVFGSPSRSSRAAPASPLRPALRRPHRVGHVKGRTPKKTARWKDEAGDGKLDDRSTALDALVFSSPSEASGPEAGGSGSDEWEEETTEESISPAQPKPVVSLPKSTIPRAISPSGLFGVPSSSTRLSTNVSPTNIPEWKKNRMLLGKTATGPSRLATLGEERESSVSPDKSGSRSALGLGAPTRTGSVLAGPSRGPLVERQDNPSTTPASSGSGFSNLLRGTASSNAKTAQPNASGKMGPARRVSSIGPQKQGRRTSSIGPYAAATLRRSRGSTVNGNTPPSSASSGDAAIEGLPVPSSSSASMSLSVAGPSALAGGARRVQPAGNTSLLSGFGAPGRRSSFMPPAPAGPSTGPPAASSSGFSSGSIGFRNGPRASLSMAQLPKIGMGGGSLSSRPSMSALRSAPSSSTLGVAAGDTSVRGPWR